MCGIEAQTARIHSEIGRNINQAKKDFAQIRKEQGLDKQALADLPKSKNNLKRLQPMPSFTKPV